MEKGRSLHLIYMICIYKWDKILIETILFLIVVWREGEEKRTAELKIREPNYPAIYCEDFEAIFPGGDSAWVRFLRREVCKHIEELIDTTGTCEVTFAIDTDGVVRDVHAQDMLGTEFARVVVEAVEKSPRWR